EQLRAPRSFRYAGNLMPLAGDAAGRQNVDAIADALTQEFGLRGLNGFDFILRAGRPVVLEVNPRYCASMELLEQASAASVFGLHVAACRGELPARVDVPPGVWGTLIVYASRTVATPDTPAWLGQGIRARPPPREGIAPRHPSCP